MGSTHPHPGGVSGGISELRVEWAVLPGRLAPPLAGSPSLRLPRFPSETLPAILEGIRIQVSAECSSGSLRVLWREWHGGRLHSHSSPARVQPWGPPPAPVRPSPTEVSGGTRP